MSGETLVATQHLWWNRGCRIVGPSLAPVLIIRKHNWSPLFRFSSLDPPVASPPAAGKPTLPYLSGFHGLGVGTYLSRTYTGMFHPILHADELARHRQALRTTKYNHTGRVDITDRAKTDTQGRRTIKYSYRTLFPAAQRNFFR